MDPLAQAKQKMANGQPLTREEATLIGNAGVTSSDINAVKNPPPAAKPSATQTGGYSLGPSTKPKPFQPSKGNVIPTPQNPQNVSNAQKIGGDVETYEQWIARTGRPMNPSAAKEYAANLAALVPKGTVPVAAPVAIEPAPIQAVTSAAPAPAKPIAPKPAPAVASPTPSGPVPVAQIQESANAMDRFLKTNPDGATLANILDAVGVGLSARGGVQRETQLSKRKQAELQYAQQAGLKAMDLDNQSKLLQIQLKNAMAQNNQEAVLQLQNRLQEIEAQKEANIEQAKVVAGVTGLTNAGGTAGLVNKYSGVGQ